jgi:DNA topoisomerase VI subunit A
MAAMPAPGADIALRRRPDPGEVMMRIERLVSHCIQAVSRGQVPEVSYPSPSAATALSPSGILQRTRAAKIRAHVTPHRMADLLALALSAYSILSSQQQRTLRDVYYDNVHQGTFGSQDRVNAATRLLCDVINVPRWQLGLVCEWRFYLLACLPPNLCGPCLLRRLLRPGECCSHTVHPRRCVID